MGSHLKVGRDLVRGALAAALADGQETFQVFVGNPRGWVLSAGDPAVDREFRDRAGEAGLRVFVHAPYLVNLGSPTEATYRGSVASVAHNLRRAAEIGAEGVVVHTGSYVAAGADAESAVALHDQALRRVREGLLPVLEALGSDGTGPRLLLEPTAGQGRSLCAGVEDLAPYLEALDRHPAVGVCLDTCHVFAAGAPLDVPGGATATLDRLVELVGADRLGLVHVNDSKDPRGSLRDRHERLGEGHIGRAAFAEMLAHPALAGVPLVAETPGSGTPGSPCLALLRELRGPQRRASRRSG